MKTVTFTEFRKHASGLLSDVEGGENLLVLRHGKAIAEVSPVSTTPEGAPSWKRRGLRLTAKGAALSTAIIEERRVKTSITLSEDLVKAIDEYGKEYNNRSEFIEEAVRVFIRQLIRRQQDARDFDIINHRADYLNREAMDVLTYQVDL